jgi:hypothetical protein
MTKTIDAIKYTALLTAAGALGGGRISSGRALGSTVRWFFSLRVSPESPGPPALPSSYRQRGGASSAGAGG